MNGEMLSAMQLRFETVMFKIFRLGEWWSGSLPPRCMNDKLHAVPSFVDRPSIISQYVSDVIEALL